MPISLKFSNNNANNVLINGLNALSNRNIGLKMNISIIKVIKKPFAPNGSNDLGMYFLTFGIGMLVKKL